MDSTSSPFSAASAAAPPAASSGPSLGRALLDATDRMPSGGRRALVLGGGGSTGNAWLIGVLAGLAQAGVAATDADLVIGTSAGSTAAAQIGGADPATLLAAILETSAGSPALPGSQILPALPAAQAGPPASLAASGPGSSRRPDGAVANHLERIDRIIAVAENPADMRRRLGASALDLSSDFDPSPRWRATVAPRLPSQDWPERPTFITAVDARTGEPVVFDRHSGLDLADAVAASCSSGFAYSAGGNAYIDGGYRAGAENADLAAGCRSVLVLSPFGGRSRTPAEWGLNLAAQAAALSAGGSSVETVFPAADEEHLFGTSAMNPALRPAAASAGYRQGLEMAEKLRKFWS